MHTEAQYTDGNVAHHTDPRKKAKKKGKNNKNNIEKGPPRGWLKITLILLLLTLLAGEPCVAAALASLAFLFFLPFEK